MLVRDKDTDNPNVVALNNKWLQRWRFLWERLYIYCLLYTSDAADEL